MSDVQKWDEIASGNSQAPPDGAPEGMARSDVNNAAREMMRAIRKFYAAGEFTIVYDTVGDAWTVSNNGALVVRLTPADGQTTDISGRFPDGSRIKVTSSGADLFGFVVSSSNSVGILDITVVFDKAADVVPATPTGIELGFLRASLEKTAFYPTGTTLAQEPPNVPTIDDLGDGALLDQGTGNGFDADTVDGQHAADIIASASTGAVNGVYNGEFSVWQRGTVIDTDTTAGRIYINDHANHTADRWKLLSGNATSDKNNVVVVSQLTTGVQTAYHSALRFAGVAAVANDFAGVFQILEARDAFALVGSTTVSMGMEFRVGGDVANARFMLLGWDGAADAPTVDPISDWQTAGDAGGPILVTNWTKLLDSGQLTPTGAWARFTTENVDISTTPNVKNLGILIYIDDPSWSTGTLDVTGVKLESSSVASTYSHVEYATELTRCMRYFQSTFQEGEDPRQNAGFAGANFGHSTDLADVTGIGWNFPVTMRAVPIVSSFNPGAVAAFSLRTTVGAGADFDLDALTSAIGTSGIFYEGTLAANSPIVVHQTADAEFV